MNPFMDGGVKLPMPGGGGNDPSAQPAPIPGGAVAANSPNRLPPQFAAILAHLAGRGLLSHILDNSLGGGAGGGGAGGGMGMVPPIQAVPPMGQPTPMPPVPAQPAMAPPTGGMGMGMGGPPIRIMPPPQMKMA